MATKISGSFDALATAAVAKAATMGSNTATIAAISKANAELVETNKHLVAQLTAAKLPFSPPGFQPVIPAAPSNPAGTGKGVSYENLATVDTGHKNNTAGVSCPAVKKSNNKWYFVAPQACSTCGKPAILHIPENCKGPTQYKGPHRTQTAPGNGVWRCAPAEDNLIVNNANQVNNEDPPVCNDPPNPRKTTALVDSGASVSVMRDEADRDIAPVQEPNLSLGTPARVPIFATKTLLLKPKKRPEQAR